MVGQLTVTKPSRSNEFLDADQQLKIANEIRAHFDSLVPKRPLKPNRSESDSSTPTPVDSTPIDENIPELDKFRALQSRSQITFSADGVPVVQDEYVETQYYRELHSIDKQHHTTGSGFIRVVGAEGEGGYDHVKLQNGQDGAGGVSCIEFRAILQQTIVFQALTRIRSLSPRNQIGARALPCVGWRDFSRNRLCTYFPSKLAIRWRSDEHHAFDDLKIHVMSTFKRRLLHRSYPIPPVPLRNIIVLFPIDNDS